MWCRAFVQTQRVSSRVWTEHDAWPQWGKSWSLREKQDALSPLASIWTSVSACGFKVNIMSNSGHTMDGPQVGSVKACCRWTTVCWFLEACAQHACIRACVRCGLQMWPAPWRNQVQQWNSCIWWFPFSLQKAARCHSHSALGYPTRASHRVWTCGQQWQRYLCFWMQTQPDLITCRTLFSHGSAPHRRWLHTTCQSRVVYGWSRLLQNRCCLGGPQAIARMVRHYLRSNNHTFASIVRLFGKLILSMDVFNDKICNPVAFSPEVPIFDACHVVAISAWELITSSRARDQGPVWRGRNRTQPLKH